MWIQSVQAVIEQITSLLLALGALGAAGASLWQSIRNRKRITVLHNQINTRMDNVERRAGSSDRRAEPRVPPA